MVENIWTEFAISYDAVIPEIYGYQKIVSKIVRDLDGRLDVIDAGCGTGLVSEALVARGHSVVGFDNNKAMLARAQDRIQKLDAKTAARWRVLEGDVNHFPDGVPGSVDGVVFNNVLFYVADAAIPLRQAFERLRVGGRVIATGPKRRPDIMKIFQGSVEEWKKDGRWDERLQGAMTHHLELAKRLAGNPEEMKTFFDVEALQRTLKDIGFGKVIAADGDDYFGESFYVCCEK